MVGTFLVIFIIVDVVLIVILAPIMFRHGKAHFKPEQHAEPEPQPVDVPADLKAQMLKDSEEKFISAINQSVSQLQDNLQVTTNDINNLIKKMAVEVVNNELQEYRDGLAKLHEQAEKDLGEMSQNMRSHETELQTKMAEEVAAEKQRLLKQIDTKLGDAVGSFLLENLGKNVDLGSQSAYLMSLLEEHKDEFKKEVDDVAPAAK